MFWHTARDDTMFTSMRCVSRHEKTQVYGAILLQHLTNQAMLESISYQTYYAYASGEKAPKEKYIQKKDESDTSPKKKTAPASKGSRLKSSAKVTKTDKKKQPATMPKTKGLAVLYEVALTEAEQIKLATKRSKTQFHSSYASGSGDRVDTQSKVPDEQQQKVTGTNEGAGVRPEVPDVPKYNSESDEESWTFSQDEEDADEETDVNDDSDETESNNDGDDLTHLNLSTYKADDQEEEEEKADDEEVSSDQRVSTPPDYELTDEEGNKEGDDKDKEGEQEQDEEDDLYRDVNINLERSDAEMTDAQANKDTEDAHVTLTVVPPIVQHQSSSVSSGLVSKFINPSLDTDIPNFASLFRFEQRVSALETEMPEFKQTNQFAKVVSSILGIVDNYLASKMKETIDVVVQLETNKIREEAQAKNHEFLNQIEKYVTESLEAKVLVRSTNQPQTSYVVAASLSEFELKKILIDKIESNKSIDSSTNVHYRRIVIQERVEDLQLGVESYQKKINLTKLNTYHSDLKRMNPYTAYPDIQGIIYEDEMNRNRLMRTDELHKFSDGTLNHVRTTLNDIDRGIDIEYFPKRKWSKQDKQRARVMIKAIDRKLRDRRSMRNLEKFVGGRPYEGDLRQNWRDLPRDIPLDSVVVLRYEKRSKSENKGKVPTEMELVLEQTQQGTSYEVSVSAEGVEELKRKVKIKGEKKEALLTLRQKPERFDTSAGNPVKEILLKLNLPDHRILKDGGEDLKAQLQDKDIAISELKKVIEKMKGKFMETKFEKSSVIRQLNAFKSQRQSILGKPVTFSDSLAKKDFSKSKSVAINNVSNDLSNPVIAQILPQNVKSILKNTNVITPGISQPKSSGKSAHAEEHGQKVDDLEDQSHQEFNIGNDEETSVREALDDDESQWNQSSSPTPDHE
ncbi:hypothetical protein Tco_0971105 [Tanacetum coccineum]